MPTDTMASGSTFAARRQLERAKLRLPGRCLLANRVESVCTTIDLAACGVAVQCGDQGQVGDHVVAYINQLGRIEGEIARQLQNGFAFKIAATPRKVDKLAARIAWLIQHDAFGAPDNRRRERVEVDDGHILVTTPDGAEHFATLIDVSSDGAAMNMANAPPIGSSATVGGRRARVVRHFAGGVGVRFQNFIPLRRLSRNSELCDLDEIANRLFLQEPPTTA
jgi:hypothetical protein